MASVSVAIRLSLLFFLPFAIASCYNPDGGLILDPAYQPCVQIVGSVSMCCATNRTADADVCLPNGLCHNPCSATGICGGSENGQYWRETCTDSSWNSPYCLKGVCTNASAGGSPSENIGMTQCLTDGTWCCGNGLTSEQCCAMSNRVVLAATIGVSSSTPSTISIPTTSTSSTSSIASPTTSSPITSPLGSSSTPMVSPSGTGDTSSSNTGLKIGLGVGIGLGVPIIAAIVAFFILRQRRLQATTLKGIPYRRGGETELEGEAGGRPGFFKRFLELPATKKNEVYEVPG